MNTLDNKVNEIALSALALASVAVITVVFPIPVGPGFVNASDVLIILFALSYGPKVGGVSGIGAAMADITLGFAFYAPFTLFTKVFTGVIVGTFRKKQTTAMAAIIISMAVMVSTYYIADTMFGEGFASAHIYANLAQALFSIIAGAFIIFGTSALKTQRD